MADPSQRLRYHVLPAGPRDRRVADDGLRIGYGAECELSLDGTEGPPVLFEVRRTPGPLRIATRLPPADMASYVELSVDGKPVRAESCDLRPGSRVDVVDKTSRRRYGLVVDPPAPWTVRPRFLAAIMMVLTALGAAYGGYLYREIETAHGVLSRTASRIERTEAGLDEARARIASTEDRLAGAVRALERERDATERALRADFEQRIDALAERARSALAEISEEDDEARAALRGEMERGLEQLRAEFASRLLESYRRFKDGERETLTALARRIEEMVPPTRRFQAVLAEAREAIVFLHTHYTIRVASTGDEQGYDSFGTGFVARPDGTGLTAQHVLFPWRYDRELLLLLRLGALEVVEDATRWTAWPTGARVVAGAEASPGAPGTDLDTENAFRSDGTDRIFRFLHAPPMATSEELVAAAVGVIRLAVPQPGASDVAVFRLEGNPEAFGHLDPGEGAAALEPLDELLAVGYPFSRLQLGQAIPQGVRGFVRRAGEDVVEVDLPLHPGISGAPLLNGSGQVVGMASAVFRSAVYGVAARREDLAAALAAAR